MTPIEAQPSVAEVVGAAESLAGRLRSGARGSEALRRVEGASLDAMVAAGLFRLMTPAVHGGLEAGLRAQVEALLGVSSADPAAGWVPSPCQPASCSTD